MARKLSEKQKAFVREYLRDSNGSQAAIRAGYSPTSSRTTSSRMLANENIQSAIMAGRNRVAAKAEVTAAWVIEQLIDNHRKANECGQLTASNKALELVGRHLGMFPIKQEVSGPGGKPVEIDTSMRDTLERYGSVIGRFATGGFAGSHSGTGPIPASNGNGKSVDSSQP
jgi:hypothetical protein